MRFWIELATLVVAGLAFAAYTFYVGVRDEAPAAVGVAGLLVVSLAYMVVTMIQDRRS